MSPRARQSLVPMARAKVRGQQGVRRWTRVGDGSGGLIRTAWDWSAVPQHLPKLFAERSG